MSEIELKRGVKDSINIIQRNIKVYIFEKDYSVYRTVAVELRKLLLDNNASASFDKKEKQNCKSIFELYYGTDILLKSFLEFKKDQSKSNSDVFFRQCTPNGYIRREDILYHAISNNSKLVPLRKWLNEPFVYHESGAGYTPYKLLNHMAGKEGAHIINPKKGDITGPAISILHKDTPNLPLGIASINCWKDFVIDAGVRLLNARRMTDKNFIIEHDLIVSYRKVGIYRMERQFNKIHI